MLDETIDLLTRQMLEDVFNDKKNKQKQMIIMSKADLYKFCIKLVKLIQRIENMEEKNEKSNFE
jgi:hypothetical protein